VLNFPFLSALISIMVCKLGGVFDVSAETVPFKVLLQQFDTYQNHRLSSFKPDKR
jgi:hypothetical protein